MLDMERIRTNPDELKRMLASRFLPADEVDVLLQQDALQRKLMADSKAKKALRNQMSRKVTALKIDGASTEEQAVVMSEMRALGPEIAVLDSDIAELDDKITAFLLSTPNYPQAAVPLGRNAKDNEEVYRWGGLRQITWEAKPYWNIGSGLRILDYGDAARFQGTQYAVYRGLGAQLERAVVSFTLDTLLKSGYSELVLPYMAADGDTESANEPPILDDDGRQPADDTPSIAALYAGQELSGDDLPVLRCAFSAGFRLSAAGGGRAAEGPARRQFHRVELLRICRPEHSYRELTDMTEQAQKLMRLLKLPYRMILRCTGMMPAASAKTYDVEAWLPGYKRYISVASCSNREAYTARELNIRCRESGGAATRFCHTLSGGGLAAGRTVAALLENHQNEDGSVTVPEALRPYMHTDVIR